MASSVDQQEIKSHILQLINRLVSSYSTSDAIESIHSLTSKISSQTNDNNNVDDDTVHSTFEVVLSTLMESSEFMKTICTLLSESKLQLSNQRLTNSRRMIHVDDGDVSVLSFINSILDYYQNQKDKKIKKNSNLLTKFISPFQEEEFHQSLSIIHSLLDILANDDNINADSSNTPSPPTSSLSPQIIYKQSTTISVFIRLLNLQPTPTIQNILQTPNGLNRIIDLIKSNYSHYDDESIVLRNDSLLLAIELVKLNPGIAKFMIFEDVYDSVMAIASMEYKAYLSLQKNKIRTIDDTVTATVDTMEKNGTDDNNDKLSNGNLNIVKDCLNLCIQMTKQEQTMGSETFLSNHMTCQVLTMLIDLRNGVYYRHYDLCLEDYELTGNMKKKKYGNVKMTNGRVNDNPNSSDPTLVDELSEDGLDDILLDSNNRSKRNANGNDQQGKMVFPIPFTTNDESKIISYALELFQILLRGGSGVEDLTDVDSISMITKSASKDSLNASSLPVDNVSSRIKSIITSQNTQTMSLLLFDMALYTLPPPNSPIEYYVSAVPSMKIQCQALNVMATLAKIAKRVTNDDNTQVENALLQQILNSHSLYLQGVGCLERVMYLICTGGISVVIDDDEGENGTPKSAKHDLTQFSDVLLSAKKVSMHSLALLRNILTPKEASLMVMHTIVPPTADNDSNSVESPDHLPQDVSVVQKLVNTMGENLHLLNNKSFSKDLKAFDKERMQINIIGAAGALGVFLANGAGDITREILLRIPLPAPPAILESKNSSSSAKEAIDDSAPTLLECIMTYLEFGASGSRSNVVTTDVSNAEASNEVTLALLRLMMEWIPNTPQVISAILSSPNSVALGFLLQQKNNSQTFLTAPPASQAMTGVLLGLCMEYMGSDDEIGGWSISSIMNLIHVGLGVGKFTQLLEAFKRGISEDVGANELEHLSSVGTWACCIAERIYLLNWYSKNVNKVRRKLVHELSVDSDDESGTENDENCGADKNNLKSLKKLVAHQSAEIETLRQNLNEKENKLTTQGSEMNMLKRRISSNPNKVDDMLDEYSAKILLLEIQIRNLKDEMVKNNAKNETVVNEQSDEILQLKLGLEQSQIEKEKVVSESNAVKEEMKGLSEAYSKLEMEYNHANSIISPEKVITNNSPEIATDSNTSNDSIMNENLKLKGDIKIANEWMSKAVKKMDDLNKRNKTLESEVKQFSSTKSLNKAEVDIQSKEVVGMKQQLYEIISQRDLLQKEVENNETLILSLNKTVDEMKTKIQVDHSYQAEIGTLRDRLANLQYDIDNDKKTYSEHIDNLNLQLKLKDEELKLLKSRNGGESMQLSHEKETIDRLQNDYKQLSDAYKAAQEWMANAVKHHEKLKKHVDGLKDENQKLKERLDESLIQTDSDISKALEEEITSLRKERTKALEQNNMLQDRLTEMISTEERLLNENSDLKKSSEKSLSCEHDVVALNLQINEALEIKNQLEADLQYSMETKKQLEAELKEAIEEKGAVKHENSILKNRMDELSARLVEVNELREKYANLQKEFDLQREGHLDKLGYDAKVNPSDLEEHNVASARLENEVQILREENQMLRLEKDESAAIKNEMHSRLEDFQAWTEQAQKRFDEMESEKATLEGQLLHIEANETKIRQDYQESLQKIQDLQRDLEESKSFNRLSVDEVEKLKTNILSLQVEIGHLDGKNQALSEDNKILEKNNVDLTHKADLLDDVEENLFEKENEVATLQESLSSMKEKLLKLESENKELVNKRHEHIKELESLLRERETQIVHQETEAKEAISKWEERCESIRSEIVKYKSERDEMEKNFLKLEAEMSSYHVSLEEVNNSLQGERDKNTSLSRQVEESTVVYKEHIKELETILQEHVDANEILEGQLDERDEALILAGKEIKTLSNELVAIRQESEDVVSKWQENGKQLEATISELEAAVENRDNEANEVIALWEERCNSLNDQIAELEQEILSHGNNLKTDVDVLQTQLAIKEKECEEANKQIQHLMSAIEEKDKCNEALQDEVMALRDSAGTEIVTLTDKVERDETIEMRMVIIQLENELRMANEALQTHLTDDVTIKATEMATNALRNQLNESREMQQVEHEAFLREKEGRLAAEEEIYGLKSDLALLLQVETYPESHDVRMQQMTSKAAGEVLKSQRLEINALSRSLEDLMQEIQQYQNKERDAEERAVNSRLHASACEQELLGAKSDIASMKETINRLTQEESELKSSLENRLKALEDERESLIETYENEIKNLNVEVTQGQIERDQLLHALTESEKANSSLVYLTSVNQESKESSVEFEMAKLRLEKAQLLVRVQENGLKFQDKSNEVINNENETSITSERNLLISAEKSFKALQLKLNETLTKLNLANGDNIDLRKLNESLKVQLSKAKQDAKLINSELEEKYRLAEAKVAEVDNSYDNILELKEALQQEQKRYQEILEDHEDLLALLAQQDLEKTSLQAALMAHVGQGAVDNAIMEAEKEAVEQFGKYIRLR